MYTYSRRHVLACISTWIQSEDKQTPNLSMSFPPPGIEGDWKTTNAGGDSSDWLPLKPFRYYTNAFVWSIAEEKVVCQLQYQALSLCFSFCSDLF